MEQKIIGGLDCLVRAPKGAEGNARHPILIYLHGAGTRNNMEALRNSIFLTAREQQGHLPFLTVCPLCTENTWFDHWHQLKAMVRELAALPSIDPTRIYLTGASMGGYATWQLAMSMPKYFAAIIPICGGGMYWNAGRLVSIPVWAFHGAKDGTVLPAESEKMVNKINTLGGDAKLTLYPENGHNAWTDTYNNPEIYTWLLSHKKKEAPLFSDQYTNAEIYG